MKPFIKNSDQKRKKQGNGNQKLKSKSNNIVHIWGTIQTQQKIQN